MLTALIRTLAVLLLASAMCAAILLATAGYWLPREDPLPLETKADAVVVLGGSVFRSPHAADLYKGGYAKRVLLSQTVTSGKVEFLREHGIQAPSLTEQNRELLRRLDVPDQAVELFGAGNRSTAEEGRALATLYADQTPTLIIVTSAYHARRAGIILSRALPEATLFFSPTPYEPFPKAWWQSRSSALAVLSEAIKTVYYLLGGGLFPDELEQDKQERLKGHGGQDEEERQAHPGSLGDVPLKSC